MGQRKLTREELQHVDRAAWYLRCVMNRCGLIASGDSVLDHLSAIEAHGTTDGKPWIEPQPDVGEGYRRATKQDKDRRDRNHWDQQSECWYYSKTGSYDANITYRVPVDRIPTDEDAVGRPTVMVRHYGEMSWRTMPLVAVVKSDRPFIALQGTVIWRFQESRFPYPGEID